jgi:alpha-tubulin suppressor-like RCC1 family protein
MSILLLGGSRVVTAIAVPLRRVEALVGRASVAQAALGTSHSLFLDGSGAVWSCGENKEVGTTSICANVLGYLEQHQPVPGLKLAKPVRAVHLPLAHRRNPRVRCDLQGQCGLGTPLELLARQRRQEWALGTNLATFAQAFSDVARDHAAAPDSQVRRHTPMQSSLQIWSVACNKAD